MATTVLDVRNSLIEDVDGLVLVNKQEITSEFLDDLSSERLAKTAMRSRDFDRVCSIPVLVYDIWIKQGRDPYAAPAKDLVKWLKEDNLEHFISTPKRV